MESKRPRSDQEDSFRSPQKLRHITTGVEKNNICTEIRGESLKPNIPFGLFEMAKDLELGEARDTNFVFSPCSIQLALGLLANGATGSTLKELLMFLEAKDLNHITVVATKLINSLVGSTGGPMISFVGGIWIDQSLTLNPNFKLMAESIYHANAKSVDFLNKGDVVVDEVNRWAYEVTNGLIESILHRPSDPNTRLLLANALYFKGLWSEKFSISDTKKSTFYLLDGTCVDVPFMGSKEEQFITAFNDFKVLRLPYKKSASTNITLSMYIILPNEPHGLWSLVEMAGSDPSFLETYLPSDTRKVEVGEFKIPKFKMTFEFEASEVLTNTGLKLPFSDNAEFSEMVLGGEGLKVSKVNHKSYIEVNEEGTEAAAVTTLQMRWCCAIIGGPRPIDFVADHPFMFMVRDDMSGMVLFMGHVINPLA